MLIYANAKSLLLVVLRCRRFHTKRLVRAPCWKQLAGYIPGYLQARHFKYVLKSKIKMM